MIYDIIRGFTIPDFLSLTITLLLFVVCLIFALFGLIRWKTHPLVSVIAIVSSILLVFGSAVLVAIWLYINHIMVPEMLRNGGAEPFRDISVFLNASNSIILFAVSVLHIILVPLMFFGIFAGRRKIADSRSGSTN